MKDRLAVSLVLALLLHAAVVLGLGFMLDMNPVSRAADTLDVVLVDYSGVSEPEEADFLAQANQQGGGDAEDVERPAQELTGVLPVEGEGMAPMNVEAMTAEQTQDARQETILEEDLQPTPDRTEIEQPEPDLPSMAELMRQRQEVARLQAQLERDKAFESRLKRRRFISANTREYEFASYMHAWVSKVERVGNLNYPSEIRRRKLVGDLLLTVGINPDGSVESMEIRRSSGIPELDDAAQRIVQLAAPFSPLPADIRSQVDVLHITRTWRFSAGNTFR